MDEDVNQDLKETVRAVDSYLANEKRKEMDKRSNGTRNSKPQRIMKLLGGLMLLALVVFLARPYRSGNNPSLEDLNVVRRGVEQLDERLGSLEEKVNFLEKSPKDLQQSILVAERSRESLSADLTKLAQKTGQFEKRIASLEGKTISHIERRHYEVRQGDTLYRIGQKYGISVDELRHLNRLAPDHVIHPGQKLIIPQSSKQ